MSVLRRLSRLVQIDLDAYFLFRDDLADGQLDSEGSLDEQAGLTFSVLEAANADAGSVEALGQLMASAGLMPRNVEPAIEKRLKSGDACAIAWDGERAVGLAWIAGPRSEIHQRFAECAQRVAGAAVLYQAYVDDGYRGRRLHISLDRLRKQYLRSTGVRETLTFVGVKNFASVRNSMRSNQRYKLIYHLAVKGPRGMVRNLYPKWAGEPWASCREGLRAQPSGIKDPQ